MDLIPVTLIRLFIPLFILKLPILGILFSQNIDVIDWKLLDMPQTMSVKDYQIWDKLLDIYFLTFVFYISLSWKDFTAKRIAHIFYLLRFAGIVLFILSGSTFLFFLFPNVFPIFALFYILYVKLTGRHILFNSPLQTGIIILSILIPNLALEYFIHIDKQMPWKYADVANMIKIDFLSKDTINFYFYGILYLILPLGVLIKYVIKAKKEKIQ